MWSRPFDEWAEAYGRQGETMHDGLDFERREMAAMAREVSEGC